MLHTNFQQGSQKLEGMCIIWKCKLAQTIPTCSFSRVIITSPTEAGPVKVMAGAMPAPLWVICIFQSDFNQSLTNSCFKFKLFNVHTEREVANSNEDDWAKHQHIKQQSYCSATTGHTSRMLLIYQSHQHVIVNVCKHYIKSEMTDR